MTPWKDGVMNNSPVTIAAHGCIEHRSKTETGTREGLNHATPMRATLAHPLDNDWQYNTRYSLIHSLLLMSELGFKCCNKLMAW